jgi:tRNA-dihydrouridine synthase
VKAAVSIPVIVNGDIVDGASAQAALAASGAGAVMIGRGVYGRPWIAAQIAAELAGDTYLEPDAENRLSIFENHFSGSLRFYGDRLGLKVFRKHLAAYIEQAPWPASAEVRREARRTLCQLDDPAAVVRGVASLWTDPEQGLAA